MVSKWCFAKCSLPQKIAQFLIKRIHWNKPSYIITTVNWPLNVMFDENNFAMIIGEAPTNNTSITLLMWNVAEDLLLIYITLIAMKQKLKSIIS